MKGEFSRFIDRLNELSEGNPEIERFRTEWWQFLLRERYSSMVFSAVMNKLDEVVFTIDPETRSIVSCNKAVQTVLGFKPQEVIGRNTAFIHLDTQHYERFGRDSEAKLYKGKRYSAEFPLRRKNGQKFEAEITVIPILDDNNWLGGVVSTIKDLSLFKAQESLRRRNTSRLRLITEQVPTILWTTDRSFTITSLMGKEVYKLRLDKRPLLHHRIEEIFSSLEDSEVLESHKSALAGERSSFEVLYEGYIFKAYVEPMYDEDETISGVIGVAYDISEQKQLEQKYAERVKELQLLSTFTELSIQHGFEIEKLMSELADQIPGGFCHPEATSVKIQLKDVAYTSKGFHDTEHELSVNIEVQGEQYGRISAFLDSCAFTDDKNPFLEEKRKLLDIVSERIGRIIEQKLKTDAFNEKTRQLEAIFENASDSIIVLDNEGRYVQMNRANEEMTGYSADELLGKSATEVLDAESRLRFQGIWADFLRQGEAFGEVNVERKNGEIRTIEYIAAAQILPNKNLVMVRDITERKKYENHLEKNLREREVLIKEIHHRVKNNLQIIISMLNLQNEELPAPDSRKILADATARVYSIALAYEKLHFTENLELVQIDDYYRDLIYSYIDEASEKISFETEIEPLFFNINAAVLTGIMVNELIHTCLKHDFSGVSGGVIKFILRKDSSGEIHLTLWDNGVQQKLHPQEASKSLLGLRLVDSLAAQIGGRVEYEQSNGFAVSVYLPVSAVLEG